MRTVATALVRTDLHLATDVGRDLTAQVALDLVVGLDVVTQRDEVVVGQLVDPQVGADAGGGEGVGGAGAPDAEDVGECDLDALVAREIDSDEACPGGSSFRYGRGVVT